MCNKGAQCEFLHAEVVPAAAHKTFTTNTTFEHSLTTTRAGDGSPSGTETVPCDSVRGVAKQPMVHLSSGAEAKRDDGRRGPRLLSHDTIDCSRGTDPKERSLSSVACNHKASVAVPRDSNANGGDDREEVAAVDEKRRSPSPAPRTFPSSVAAEELEDPREENNAEEQQQQLAKEAETNATVLPSSCESADGEEQQRKADASSKGMFSLSQVLFGT